MVILFNMYGKKIVGVVHSYLLIVGLFSLISSCLLTGHSSLIIFQRQVRRALIQVPNLTFHLWIIVLSFLSARFLTMAPIVL